MSSRALCRALLLTVALVAASAACHTDSTHDEVPPASLGSWGPGDAGLPQSLEGSLTIGRRVIDLGVYLPNPPSNEELAAARDTAKVRLPGVTILSAPGNAEPPTALVFAPKASALPPPPVDLIHGDGRGIKPGQAESIAASKGLVALVFRFEDDPSLARLHAVQTLALGVARAGGGAIWDESTREVYAADRWEKVRVDAWEGDRPEVRRHIALHYDDSPTGRQRLLSLGMQKFGLPDLVIPGVTPEELASATRVIDGVAQLLVEGAKVEHGGVFHLDFGAIKHQAARKTFLEASGAGAKLSWALTLVPVLPENGDPENRIVEIRLPPPLPDVGTIEAGAPRLLPVDAGRPR